MKREDVEFQSEGATLRGWLYVSSSAETPAPLVIMAPGFSATRTMVFDRYAERYAAAGMAVLLFDHRNFGTSDGHPRRQMNPWIQVRGYRAALTWARGRPEIDRDRIALWGASNAGGLALVAASVDERVAAVVVQTPSCGEVHPPADPDGTRFEQIRRTLLDGDVSGSAETTRGPMPVVSNDPGRDAPFLSPLTAHRWFVDYGGREGSGWSNDVTVVVPTTPEPYHVGLAVPHISVPLLMMVAPDDEIARATPAVARRAFEACPAQSKEWVAIPGGHFGHLYCPSELFEKVTNEGVRFLEAHLGSRQP